MCSPSTDPTDPKNRSNFSLADSDRGSGPAHGSEGSEGRTGSLRGFTLGGSSLPCCCVFSDSDSEPDERRSDWSSGSGMDPPSLSESEENSWRDGGNGSTTRDTDCAWFACGGVDGPTLVCRGDAEPGYPTPQVASATWTEWPRENEVGNGGGGGGPTRWACGAIATGGEGLLKGDPRTDAATASPCLCAAVLKSRSMLPDEPALAPLPAADEVAAGGLHRGCSPRLTRPPILCGDTSTPGVLCADLEFLKFTPGGWPALARSWTRGKPTEECGVWGCHPWST